MLIPTNEDSGSVPKWRLAHSQEIFYMSKKMNAVVGRKINCPSIPMRLIQKS